MNAIIGDKGTTGFLRDTIPLSERTQRSSAITAHFPPGTIRIEIYHPIIMVFCGVEQQNPVSANTELAMAQPLYGFSRKKWESSIAIISNDKIVASGGVFVKSKFVHISILKNPIIPRHNPTVPGLKFHPGIPRTAQQTHEY